MDQKERDAQRALGHMEEFRVVVIVPIKVKVRMVQNVEAVSEEDAIEKMKMIHDIIPAREFLRNALLKVKDYGNKAVLDTAVDCEYTAQQLNEPKEGEGNPQCDGGSSGGSI